MTTAQDGDVPRVETGRLVLRGWTEADIAPHAELCADPDVMSYLGGTRDARQAWRGVAFAIGHWSLRGFGLWVVERRDEPGFLGRVGLLYPEGWPGIEVAWTLARQAWGHGYATEAARAAIDWAWRELDAARLISLIDVGNDRSTAVAERLGMSFDRRETIDGDPTDVYEIKRPTASDRLG
ncbi:MAG: GNAT family N-acetyltransferase [Solirubrobacterales bacterium]|nr:GNAT family N-acetyltransferase [Solirubrobacterales bacterium]